MLMGFGYATLASAGVLYNMAGHGSGVLWAAHGSFVLTLLIFALGSDLAIRAIEAFFATPAGVSVVLLLCHYLVGIVWLLDTAALSSHLRTDLLRYCIPGLMLGAFALLPLRRADWVPRTSTLGLIPWAYAGLAVTLLIGIAARQRFGTGELRFAFAPEFANGYQSLSAFLLAAFCLWVGMLMRGMTGFFWRELGRLASLGLAFLLFAAVSAFSGSKKEILAMALVALCAGLAILARDLRVGRTAIKRWASG
jgi:hypothetical protein